MSTYTAHSPDSLEQSSLNFFQLASFQLKIRYNAGLSFPSTNPGTIASLWYQTIATHGAHLQIGLARLANDPTKARPILVRQPFNTGASTTTKLKFAPPVLAKLEGRSMEEILVRNLYPEQDLPVTGTAILYIFTNGEDQAVSLVVNLCAALWDATTIHSVFQTFMKLLEAQTSVIANPPSTKDLYTQLGGWEKFLQAEVNKAKEILDPLFLPMGDNVVGITDILKGTPAATLRERRVSTTLNGEVVGACRRVMDPHGVSTGGLTSACFVYALAEAYFREHTQESSVTLVQSIQLDPRTMLPDNTNNKYIQAIGIISTSSTVSKADLEGQSVVDWLVTEAKRAGIDLQTRLERGEGLHRTLEIATGQIDPNNRVTACLEVVDHGVYDTPSEEYEIELGHRMDICPHMSIVIHTERASGKQKLEAQMGIEQGREATLRWLERCTELWKEIAAGDI